LTDCVVSLGTLLYHYEIHLLRIRKEFLITGSCSLGQAIATICGKAQKGTGQVDVRGIEVPEVAEEELLALDGDDAESEDVMNNVGDRNETD